MATYNLTYICTNCSPTEESTKQLVVDGTTNNTYSFVSEYGYKFTNETKVIIRRKNASGNFYDSALTGKITENGTKYSGTVSVSEERNFPPFSLVMSAVRDGTITLRTLNITNNIPNSTVEYEQTSATGFNIKLTCANGFTGTPQITYTNPFGSESKDEMTVSGNVATITVNIDSYSDDVTFSYKQIDPQNIPITYDLTNCEVVGNKPDSIALNETLTVTVKANEKATLETLQIAYNDSYGAEKTVDGEINETGKTGTVSFTPTSTDILYIEVRATATTDEPTLKGLGAINVYKVTLENLNEFAQKRFFTATDGTNSLVNLGDYVNRIKRIYTNVENGATDVIRCGNYNTKISVFQPVKSKITLDFGNVVVPSHNNDNTDFESTVKLFIPFVGFVDVPNDYTGETINLQIDINVVTGNGLYRLIYNGTLIQTGDCTPSQDVLYKTADIELTKIGGDDWNEQLYMGLEPYMLVKWYESKNPNGRNNDFKNGNISSFTGFNSFDNVVIQPTANMLAREQEMILATLLKGVYVE